MQYYILTSQNPTFRDPSSLLRGGDAMSAPVSVSNIRSHFPFISFSLSLPRALSGLGAPVVRARGPERIPRGYGLYGCGPRGPAEPARAHGHVRAARIFFPGYVEDKQSRLGWGCSLLKKLLLNWCSEMIWCSKLWAAKSLTIYGHWVVCWSLNVPTSTQEFCVFEKCWGPCLSRPLQAIILQTLLYSVNHQSNACHLTSFHVTWHRLAQDFLFDKQFTPNKQQRVLTTERVQQHYFCLKISRLQRSFQRKRGGEPVSLYHHKPKKGQDVNFSGFPFHLNSLQTSKPVRPNNSFFRHRERWVGCHQGGLEACSLAPLKHAQANWPINLTTGEKTGQVKQTSRRANKYLSCWIPSKGAIRIQACTCKPTASSSSLVSAATKASFFSLEFTGKELHRRFVHWPHTV